MAGLTLVEPERWEEVRRRVYLPQEADEYSCTSQPLSDVIQESVHAVCSSSKPVKMGYITDLCREGGVSPCALVLGLLYIQRLAKMNPRYLARTSSTDVFLTAMVVASKYLQDEGEVDALLNSEWAQIGHRHKSAVDALERKFLDAISWNLYVSLPEYYRFVATVEAKVAILQAGRRGWWSYTDLTALWNSSESPQSMIDASKQAAKVVGGGMAAYVVCLATLVSTAQALTVCVDTNVTNQLQTTSSPGLLPSPSPSSSSSPLSLASLDRTLLDWNSLNKHTHGSSFDDIGLGRHWSMYAPQTIGQIAEERHVGSCHTCAPDHYKDVLLMMTNSLFTAVDGLLSVNCTDSDIDQSTNTGQGHLDTTNNGVMNSDGTSRKHLFNSPKRYYII